MSDNPFKSQPDEPVHVAVPATTGPAPPPSAPGALTPILVFCLIFGIFGLIGTCMGGVGLASMSVVEGFLDSVPNVPEEQKEFNKINMAAQRGAMVPGIVLMLINLVLATTLIMGSIGCFKRKEASRAFLRTALLAAVVYSVLKIVVTIYSAISANSAINTAIENLKDDPMYQDILTQHTSTQIFTTIGMVVSMVIAVAMLGFYLWSRSYLNKTSVIEHFAAVQRYKQTA